MRQKFVRMTEEELSLTDQFTVISAFIEYPKQDDYVNLYRKDLEEDIALDEYLLAKRLYKYIHLKLKDSEIAKIAMGLACLE